MSRITGPKARICRAHGVNLFGSSKYDRILAKKPYAPGIHGPNGAKKLSQFGRQLKAKQLARMIFGVSEKQLRNYAVKAAHQVGDTGDNLMRLLESRLDNVVLKAGFAKTVFQARQMVNHGHFEVNGRKAGTPSILIKTSDVITVREKYRSSSLYETTQKISPKNAKVAPGWLQVDNKTLSITVIDLPQRDHFDPLINIKPIVEFYSR